VYEQLDQLETDVKAFSDFMAEDSIDSTRCDVLVDFFDWLSLQRRAWWKYLVL
jgi:hypothetical protein